MCTQYFKGSPPHYNRTRQGEKYLELYRSIYTDSTVKSQVVSMPQIFEVSLVHSHEISLIEFDSLLYGRLEIHPPFIKRQ